MSSTYTCSQCGAVNPADVCQCRCGALNYGSDEQDESASKRIKVDVSGTSDPFPFALVGKYVAVQGLAQKPQLNGLRALVKDFDFPSARYSVDLDGGLGTFKLKRENLRDLTAAPAQDPAQASPAQADPNIGRTVEVQGLNARPELNGMRGVITEHDAASGRYTVDIEGGVGAFRLKPDNLKDPTVAAAPRQEIFNGAGPGGPQQKGGLPQGQVVRSINVSLMDKGAIIGSGGKQINTIRQESGAYVQIETSPVDPEMAVLTLRGAPDQIEVAENMVKECVAFANRPREHKPVFQKKILDVPKPYVAGVIGKGGCFLKEMSEQSQCKIFFQLAVEHDPTAAGDKQLCIIQGPPQQLPYAEQLVWAKVAEVTKFMEGKPQSWGGSTWEPPKKEVCKFHQNGFCGFGDKCTKAHEGQAPKEVCKHFQSGWCGFGDACTKLHDTASAAPKEVCPHFLNGTCAFGDSCNKSHDKASAAPKEVCPHFLNGTCAFGDSCNKSHDTASAAPKGGKEVCPHFLNGACSFGDRCNKLHDAASVAPKEVCPHFLNGSCTFGDKCYKLHDNSQAQGGASWNASGTGQANNGGAWGSTAAWSAPSPASTSWNAPSPANTSWNATAWNAPDASSGQSAGVPSMAGMPAMPSNGGIRERLGVMGGQTSQQPSHASAGNDGWSAQGPPQNGAAWTAPSPANTSWNAPSPADTSWSGQSAGVPSMPDMPAMPSSGGLRERLGVMGGPQTSQQPSQNSAGNDGWSAQGWAAPTMPAAFAGGTAPPQMAPPMMSPPMMTPPMMTPPMMSAPPGLSAPHAGGNAGWSVQSPADTSWNTPAGSHGNASWSQEW